MQFNTVYKVGHFSVCNIPPAHIGYGVHKWCIVHHNAWVCNTLFHNLDNARAFALACDLCDHKQYEPEAELLEEVLKFVSSLPTKKRY